MTLIFENAPMQTVILTHALYFKGLYNCDQYIQRSNWWFYSTGVCTTNVLAMVAIQSQQFTVNCEQLSTTTVICLVELPEIWLWFSNNNWYAAVS